MSRHWNRFLDILSFMTTLPVRSGGFDEEFHRGVMFFPTIGLILGLVYVTVESVAQPIFGEMITAILVIVTGVLLTGGLHLDGLGDTFDGVYSYRSREKIMEIMKDSRIGTNGLLAIFLVLLLKIAGLAKLLDDGYTVALFVPIAGRIISMTACYVGIPAKTAGSGNAFIGKVSQKDYRMGLFSGLLYLLLFSLFLGKGALLLMNLLALGGAMIFVMLFIRQMKRRIGGLTGDVLGAICELAEMVYLLVLCGEVGLLWSFI